MKAWQQFTTFFNRIAGDEEIGTSHISIYMALFHSWKQSSFATVFNISRREIMHYSKIGSIATYHKCIRQLQEKGHITYQPSYNPHLGSQVSLLVGENPSEEKGGA